MVINFGAGPAKLPREVFVEVQKELLNYANTGLSVMEISHRSKDYMTLHDATLQSVRDILNLPDNYKVILLQGGATGMFAGVALNLIGRTGTADYIVTGGWSSKAAKEAAKYGKVNLVLPKVSKYTTIPGQSTWNLDPNASYVYYCDNETADGTEFPFIPETNGVPLVVDMSSNIFSRPFDITKFGVVYAGAQKNFGPAGITVVIVREDLMNHALPITPAILNFKENFAANSEYNTPPTFIIYVVGKVLEWIKRSGGIKAMYENSIKKSKMVYDRIEKSAEFYSCPIDKPYQSRMNVVFRVGGKTGDEALEAEFLKGAQALKMLQLKGHRSVGGIRASLYNAVTLEDTETLVNYMDEFLAKHKK
ncbi:probable phosphoserine aminotransferase [Contarinia nasturtii]|uniref:probable phosphoserine aminotransferase n=1 Tax=Contarinia nasturtii TaxID=265458 RepID=UPI0012D3C7AC|nr:probable phosphoserine aminotransferase [Contarinia nasturtii]